MTKYRKGVFTVCAPSVGEHEARSRKRTFFGCQEKVTHVTRSRHDDAVCDGGATSTLLTELLLYFAPHKYFRHT